MIPVSLTLQGIHSYQEQQTIDFRSLTSSQLFGIFGRVGCGKSTILEAIMLALYGRSERLEKQKGIGYDVMNLRSNRLYIDFTFEVGADRQLYRFTVHAKRNQQNFEDVGALQNSAYQWQGNDWLPLMEKTAEPILGLSYDHFKRTIIIPQGKFQEFLQLSDSQRTEMMQDLFNLHRFDLTDNVKTLKSNTNQKLQQIEGELEGYKHVSNATVIEAWETLHTQLNDIDLLSTLYRQKEAEYQRLHQLKEKQERYREAKERYQHLAAQKRGYDELEITLKQVEKCRSNFQDRLQKAKKLETDIEENQNRLQQYEETLKDIENEKKQAEKQLQQLQEQFNDQVTLQQYITDLQTIRSIQQFKKQLSEKNHALEKAQQELEKAQQAFIQQDERCQNIQKQFQEQYHQIPDQSTLSAVKSWFTHYRTYLEKTDHAYKEVNQKLEEIQKLKSERQQLIRQHHLDSLNPDFREYSVKALRPALQKLRDNYKAQKDQLDEEIKTLKTQEALETYGANLEQGKPCPVCGSHEHPEPLKPGDTAAHVKQKQQQKEDLRQWLEAINQVMEGLEGLRQQYQQLKQEHDRQNQLLEEARQQLETHKKAFTWQAYKDFTEQQIDEHLTEAQAQQKHLQSLERQRHQEEQAKEQARDTRDQTDKTVQELKQEVNGLQERIDSYYRQIQKLAYKEHAEQDKQNLEQLEQQWQQDYQRMQSLSNFLEQQKPKIDEQRQNRDQAQATLEEQQRQWQELQTEITHLLTQSEFDSLGKVQRLLDDYQNEDLEAKQTEVTNFQQQYQAQQEVLEELEQQLADEEVFDQQTYEAAREAFENARKTLQDARQKLAVQWETVQRLQQQLIYKQKVEKQYQRLQDRIHNFHTLERLFRGKGFVKYISAVFMRELCQAANERFRRLTNNQLQLEATDNANLQIRDLLNDGRLRSVKTLSGGQTFQVSLSLALALAEQIQHLTRSPQNFFFLDEGFGSLDPESLNMVFDTLNRLRQENRIVGIISHVEELKEGLETALTVENHPERGSLITRTG